MPQENAYPLESEFTCIDLHTGIGAKMRVRATLLARRTMIFLAGDPCVNLRQYKQVCERAKAKVGWHRLRARGRVKVLV